MCLSVCGFVGIFIFLGLLLALAQNEQLWRWYFAKRERTHGELRVPPTSFGNEQWLYHGYECVAASESGSAGVGSGPPEVWVAALERGGAPAPSHVAGARSGFVRVSTVLYSSAVAVDQGPQRYLLPRAAAMEQPAPLPQLAGQLAQLFVARVACGCVYPWPSTLSAPGQVGLPQGYHSVAGVDGRGDGVVVVFDAAQVYPAYLVTYLVR